MASSIDSASKLFRWFVSIKLSIETNYDWWPEMMTCDGESHVMQGFLHDIFKTSKENGDSKDKVDRSTVELKL
ncbi:unnamed protein product [Lactuca virosa]|uniref:Uncharacterized protein n=1 Tax=Lactuca virosa TaxID=75947 RepID=A0AAU9NNT6_9ASTR|nr:unnamed protein product [Lactuca virosa]